MTFKSLISYSTCLTLLCSSLTSLISLQVNASDNAQTVRDTDPLQKHTFTNTMKEISMSQLPNELTSKISNPTENSSPIISVAYNKKTYTAIRALQLWNSTDAAFYYEQALLSAEKTMADWAKSLESIANGNNLSKEDIDKLKKINLAIKSSTDSDADKVKILNQISELKDSNAVNSALKLQQDEIKKLSTLVANSDEIMKNLLKEQVQFGNAHSLLTATRPTAILYFGAIRLPEAVRKLIITMLSRFPNAGNWLANIAKGSITFSTTLVPWIVTVTDSTGKQIKNLYFEKTVLAWGNIDAKGKLIEGNGAYRLGAGLLFGEIKKLDDIAGVYTGISVDLNLLKREDGDFAKDFGTNVKVGAILTSESIKKPSALPIQNAYFMISTQKGLMSSADKNSNLNARGNIGIVLPAKEIAKDLIPSIPSLADIKNTFTNYLNSDPADPTNSQTNEPNKVPTDISKGE